MSEQKWIKMSERLPEDRARVLVYDVVDGVFEACHIKSVPQWEFADGYYASEMRYDFITHWMPLPEPPAEVTK